MNEREIFLAALKQPNATERAACLDLACGTDAKLRCQIEALLAQHEKLGSYLEFPVFAVNSDGTAEELPMASPGTRIGPYKLLEQIGEGGMGLIFVAEQQQPVRRKVALKLIKPGMDSRQVIARFEAERQALAIMDHPNIAKVLDGGATPEGRPYFVMDLVKGAPITDYCDRNCLGMHQRLELFRDVCQAVQHAHQKGIIHRDLKPSNVLVEVHDVRPVVKIIDFGIAKAIGQQLTDKTLYTGIAQMIGTPLYMSPEQAGLSSLDVDTRSDVYALGVLLYELLTGTTPFDGETLKKAGHDEMRRIVREDEPPKPSGRLSTMHDQMLSTIAEKRGMEPRKLGQQMRGELDLIVMKALEKDRNRRYESASALAADVQRYLADEPVEACPPSRRYRLGKFLRKHRKSVLTAAGLVAAALVLGAGIGYTVLDRAERRAETESQRAATEQAVAGDLKEAENWRGQDQWAKAIQALERAAGRLENSGLASLQAQVEERRKEAAFVARLEKARLEALALSWREDREYGAADRAYHAAFAENDLDVTALTAAESIRLMRASAIRAHLVRALDNWALCKDHVSKDGGALRAIAQLVDDDTWRHRLRDSQLTKDRLALEALAAEADVLDQPPENLLNLFFLLEDANASPVGLRLLRRAQQVHPADFWINYELGFSLADTKTAAEAVAYCRAALAIQPKSPVVYLNLAVALVLCHA